MSYKQARLCQRGFWSIRWAMASNSGSEVPERTLHLRLVLLMRKKWFPSFSVMLFTYVSGELKWNVALEGAISPDVIKPLRSCWFNVLWDNLCCTLPSGNIVYAGRNKHLFLSHSLFSALPLIYFFLPLRFPSSLVSLSLWVNPRRRWSGRIRSQHLYGLSSRPNEHH